MILSVSRRTDIPAFYSDWFFNRIKEGYLYVKNPMNPHQVSRIDLSPDVVDCIVFWTKNPKPMLERLEELRNYQYYFQITVTGYGHGIEPGIPDKKTVVLPAFKELSQKIGKEKTIWRYDPILINETYDRMYHIRAFDAISDILNGYTEKVIISFVDLYQKTQRNTTHLKIKTMKDDEMIDIASEMAAIAKAKGMTIESCAESIDLSQAGVEHGHCIDKSLIESIIGCSLKVKKDKNQREECGCYESVEIGTYNTCRNGCKYCYANYNDGEVKRQAALYDPDSPILCGAIDERNGDKINIRKVKSLKEKPQLEADQISIFDSLV